MNRLNMPTFTELVLEERRRQDLKWGRQDHYDRKWLSILAEEFGEIAKEINEHGTEARMIEEMVQVSAVCEAWYEAITRRTDKSLYNPPTQ